MLSRKQQLELTHALIACAHVVYTRIIGLLSRNDNARKKDTTITMKTSTNSGTAINWEWLFTVKVAEQSQDRCD